MKKYEMSEGRTKVGLRQMLTLSYWRKTYIVTRGTYRGTSPYVTN